MGELLPARGCFSLPTQRCFWMIDDGIAKSVLFSAYAEVFPQPGRLQSSRNAFLCLRRGVSQKSRACQPVSAFSLPTQRCFSDSVADAPAIGTFLCLRRGVSIPSGVRVPLFYFSLPTQRCFLRRSELHWDDALFSAYAEVFLRLCLMWRHRFTFLCLRRGVSSLRTSPT